jgi:hypothetical protein
MMTGPTGSMRKSFADSNFEKLLIFIGLIAVGRLGTIVQIGFGLKRLEHHGLAK